LLKTYAKLLRPMEMIAQSLLKKCDNHISCRNVDNIKHVQCFGYTVTNLCMWGISSSCLLLIYIHVILLHRDIVTAKGLHLWH